MISGPWRRYFRPFSFMTWKSFDLLMTYQPGRARTGVTFRGVPVALVSSVVRYEAWRLAWSMLWVSLV